MPVTILTPDDLQPITSQLNALASVDVGLIDQLASLEARVAALEIVPDPDPQPTELNLQLLGGWRIPYEYARGSFAIDHANRKLYMAAIQFDRSDILEFNLPAHGVGEAVSGWPVAEYVRTIPAWWPVGYANGLKWHNGKLWCCPRVYYDGSAAETTTIYATDGEQVVINLPRQPFAGFVKSATGYELGCGGYESGSGSAWGPTLASLGGTVIISHTIANGWDDREKREPNYYPAEHIDGWYALEPRNGEGRWASDRIYGGGVRLASGIYYWPWMGTGDINYSRQNETFAADGMNRTYQYRYDPVTYQLLGWKEFGDWKVQGQEVSPDGLQVYLMQGQAWASGMYRENSALRLYGIN